MNNKYLLNLILGLFLLIACKENNNPDLVEEYCGDITVSPTELIDEDLPLPYSYTIVRKCNFFVSDSIEEKEEIPYTLVRVWTGPDFCINGQ